MAPPTILRATPPMASTEVIRPTLQTCPRRFTKAKSSNSSCVQNLKNACKNTTSSKTGYFLAICGCFFQARKKIFNRQSLVNPHSAPSPPPSRARLRPSVAPHPRKYPYNASSKRACNIPLPDENDLLKPAQELAHQAPPDSGHQAPGHVFLFIACVHCCNKRFPMI